MPFLEPMVALPERVAASGSSASTARAATASTSSTSTTPRRCEMADQLAFFRLMVKQAAKEAGLVATFMPKPYTIGLGLRAPLQHEHRRPRRPRRTSSATPTTSGARAGASSPTRFVAGIMRHAPAIAAICDAHGQLLQAAAAAPRRRHRVVGAACSRRTATTTARACSGCPATGPRSRTAASTRPPTPTSPPRSCSRPGWKASARASTRASRSRTSPTTGAPGPPAATCATRLPRNLLEAIEAFDADPLTHEVFPESFVSAYGDMKRASGTPTTPRSRTGNARPI